MIDRVDTPVPGDGAAVDVPLPAPPVGRRHRRAPAARPHGLTPLTVAITGSSGLVGSQLAAFLSTGGHRVIRLVRHAATKPDERQWNPDDPDPGLLAGVDAVIHLAGASIAGRFTDEHRAAIRDSRIGPTRRLAELIAQSADGPKVLVSASAIGYYGYDRGDETLTEDSERGDGFLADVVADWEARDRAGRASRHARGAGAHRDRAVPRRRNAAPAPAAVHRRTRRPTRQRPAVVLLDRDRRPRRRLPPRAVGHRPVRAGQRGGPRAGPQRRLHPDRWPTCCAGPRCCRCRRSDRRCCSANRVRANSRWPTSGCCPRDCRTADHRFRRPDLEQTLRHLLGAQA